MSPKTIASIIMLVAGLGMASPAMSQTPLGSSSQDVMSQHHRRLYELMKDMTAEMAKMTETMSHDLTSEQRTAMAKRMEAMSSMMRRMSGFEAMPAMSDAQNQEQMNQMRKQMDEMMNAPAMKSGSK